MKRHKGNPEEEAPRLLMIVTIVCFLTDGGLRVNACKLCWLAPLELGMNHFYCMAEVEHQKCQILKINPEFKY